MSRVESRMDELRRVAAVRPLVASRVEEAIGRLLEAVRTAGLTRQMAPIPALSWLFPSMAAQAAKGVVRQYAESIGWAVGIALLIRFFLFEPFTIPTGSMLPTLQIGDHIFVSKSAFGIKLPFVDDYLVRWDLPKRGDIVVFPFPVKGHQDYGKDFIKRVVGLPGDRIALRANRLVINGEPVGVALQEGLADCGGSPVSRPCDRCVLQRETLDDHSFISQHCPPTALDHRPDWPRSLSSLEGAEFVVPDEALFVMGDNRDNSADGRFWSADPLDQFTPQFRPDAQVQTVPLRLIKGRAVLIWWATDKSRLFSVIE